MAVSASPPTLRRRVVVRGRVQGVWFRGFTRDQAITRGLAGWVRNNPDGSVEAVAEGPPEAVDAWIAALREGPPLARVTAVDVRDEESAPPLSGFEIRR